jgi:hypothetical protein
MSSKIDTDVVRVTHDSNRVELELVGHDSDGYRLDISVMFYHDNDEELSVFARVARAAMAAVEIDDEEDLD